MSSVHWLGMVLLAHAIGCGGDDAPPGGGMDGGAGTDATHADGGGGGDCDPPCDDGIHCNGTETCVGGTCAPGTAVVCNDGNACTSDLCDEEAMGCVFVARDSDGDGHGAMECGGDDCDDGDAERFPGNPEVCDASHDEDCDAITYGSVDADGDGYDSAACCNADSATSFCGTDCDDAENTVHPGEAELCNGRDDDCNGMIDDGALLTFYRDVDNDDYGRDDMTVEACSSPAGYAVLPGDCDDARDSVHPGVADGPTENCNMLDDNCDGTADTGCGCTVGATRMCGEPNATMTGFIDTGECAIGTQRCVSGTWAECVGGVTAVPEVCNTLDDDCDGTADDGVTVSCRVDADGDHYPATGAPAVPRCPDDARPDYGRCPPGYTSRTPAMGADCDDTTGTISPIATEVCDGEDNDCDGMLDEIGGSAYYRDADMDTYGSTIPGDVITACSRPEGYVDRPGDCNDTNAAIHQGAMESCATALVDEDCDGAPLNGCTCTSGMTQSCGVSSTPPCRRGTQTCGATGMWGPCMGNIDPVMEMCDGADNDCDGIVDDGVGTTYYRDADGDGYGFAAMPRTLCMVTPGYVANMTDCNDMNAAIHPLALERCDGVDGDCDGASDETDVTMAGCTFPHTNRGPFFGNWCGVVAGGGWQCLIACDPGWGACDGDVDDADGCEHPLYTDTDCSTCGDRCGSTTVCCTSGEPGCPSGSYVGCWTCGASGDQCCAGSTCRFPGLSCQGGVCRDCGGIGEPCCGTDCDGGRTCSGGFCT